jgi:hypothetical protein
VRFAERYERKFAGGARIWQSLEWLPQIDDIANWIMNAEVGVSAPIVKSLDVRLVVAGYLQQSSGRRSLEKTI